jgi:hypothetical protein
MDNLIPIYFSGILRKICWLKSSIIHIKFKTVYLALEYELMNDAYSYYLRFTVLVDLGFGTGIKEIDKMTILPSINILWSMHTLIQVEISYLMMQLKMGKTKVGQICLEVVEQQVFWRLKRS